MISKIKPYLCKIGRSIFPISFFCILAYEVDGIRNIFKAIVLLIQAMYSYVFPYVDFVSYISEYYYIVEYISIVGILLSCAFRAVGFCIRKISDIVTEHKEGHTVFEQRLLNYLNDKIPGRCFLITGVWGSGKTYDVRKFIGDNYKCTNRKVYEISCFGLSCQSELIDEINSVIKRNDTSFGSTVVEWIRLLPIVGGVSYELLKRRYDYKFINRNSIFVFDDFERIVMPTDHSTKEQNGIRTNMNYNQSTPYDNRAVVDSIYNVKDA